MASVHHGQPQEDYEFDVIMAHATEMRGAFVPGSLELLDSLGLALYFDKQHLTSAGAFYLWPYLCTFFRSNGLFGTSSHKNWQKLERNGFNLL